jgi:hypothetical protein
MGIAFEMACAALRLTATIARMPSSLLSGSSLLRKPVSGIPNVSVKAR